MASESLHEPREDLSEGVIDKHRAVASLMEELEAIDWYDQRAAATRDEELKAILIHNRNEEMEHAAMVLEWLRRRHPEMDEHLRTYLFCEGDILAAEERASAADGGDEGAGAADGSLGIGSLRESAQDASA